MQLSRLLLNIMLLCILATVIVGATWKNALPEQPARVERHGDESIRPSGQPGWEPASKPRYILASGTPGAPTPTQPPPTPTQPPPCECGARPSGFRGQVKCGDDCTTTPCVWPDEGWPSSMTACLLAHEQIHMNDPNTVCVGGHGVAKDEPSRYAGECTAATHSINCFYQVLLANQDPGLIDVIANQINNAGLLANTNCLLAGTPAPTPPPPLNPTPDPCDI